MLYKFKRLLTIRFILTLFLLLSMVYAAYSAFYKIEYWGFSFSPKTKANLWTIEANIQYEADGNPVKISLAAPQSSDEYKILEEDIIAPGYETSRKDGRILMTSPQREGVQNVYYRILLFDNESGKGKTQAPVPPAPQKPIYSEQTEAIVKELLILAQKQPGDLPQQLIRLFNQVPPEPTVVAFLPDRKTAKDTAETIERILAYKGIPSRLARGVKLAEDKKSFAPDLMLEAYIGNRWKLYNLTTGQIGLPADFIIFQRGGSSLLDLEGGSDSSVKFSVLKSLTSSFKLAGKRAKLSAQNETFEKSIYNLPVKEQNTLKWLMIFPLAILVIAVIRNIIGLQTMGTFTPMLLAMSLVETGLLSGLVCFSVIITAGLVVRALFSKLNLLLVPRISAVVICVILIIQAMTVLGYNMDIKITASAASFPIIIMAWVIERASITWEEEGPFNAGRQVLFSIIAAILTYFIICNETIRYIMFAFNELNLVILFLVMLLGTYTGYRLTELKRFRPLVK